MSKKRKEKRKNKSGIPENGKAKAYYNPSKINLTCQTTTKYSPGSAGSCESKSAAKLSMSKPADLLTVSGLRLSVVCSS